MRKTTPRALNRLRKLCAKLPAAHEVETWDEPTFRVGRKMFAKFSGAQNHPGNGRCRVWIKATAANQDFLVHTNPDRFFVPPYMGPSGWVGVYLDGDVDWDEVYELLDAGYRTLLPKRKSAALTVSDSPPQRRPAR